MEDRLPSARADVDGHTVIRQALARSNIRHELEHPLRFVGRELADVAERVDVPLGEYGKTCTFVSPASATVRSVCSKARSPSLGKPTMTSLVRLNSPRSGSRRRRYVATE